MAWLYVRYNPQTQKWYAGRTGEKDYHDRSDSRDAGPFAVDMSGKELAVHIDGEYMGSTPSHENVHYVESEGIQFLRAFVGYRNCANRTQLQHPQTGFETSDIDTSKRRWRDL